MAAMDPWTRREFLRIAAAAGFGAALAACASEPESPSEQGESAGEEPSPVFNEPESSLSGTLSILLWSHVTSRINIQTGGGECLRK